MLSIAHSVYERCKEEISGGTDLVKKTTKFWLILLAVAYCSCLTRVNIPLKYSRHLIFMTL